VKYTFGNTPAAQTLETLLDDKPSARRKVSRLLSTYTSKLFNITGAKDPETVLVCMDLLREQTLKRVDIIKGVPKEVRSYTKNVIIYRYRVYRESFESLIPVIRRMIAREKGLTSGNKGV
jgi:hypothetical protein